MMPVHRLSFFFFFNDTATTEIYTLSLHDALPIFAVTPDVPPDAGMSELLDRYVQREAIATIPAPALSNPPVASGLQRGSRYRSEEHTSELQSHLNLVCRLLLEKKNNNTYVSATVV